MEVAEGGGKEGVWECVVERSEGRGEKGRRESPEDQAVINWKGLVNHDD